MIYKLINWGKLGGEGGKAERNETKRFSLRKLVLSRRSISIFSVAFIAFQNEIEIGDSPPIVTSHGNYFRCFRFCHDNCDLTERRLLETMLHDFHPLSITDATIISDGIRITRPPPPVFRERKIGDHSFPPLFRFVSFSRRNRRFLQFNPNSCSFPPIIFFFFFFFLSLIEIPPFSRDVTGKLRED